MAVALAVTLMTLAPLGAQDPAPGISRELARTRKTQIENVEYDLHFRLEDGAPAITGEVWIRFELTDATDTDSDEEVDLPLVLDFAGEGLQNVRVNDRDAAPRIVHNHIVISPELLVTGLNGIVAEFRSPIAPTGTPLTVYEDPAVARRGYGVSRCCAGSRCPSRSSDGIPIPPSSPEVSASER